MDQAKQIVVPDILARIVAYKRAEVEARRMAEPQEKLEQAAFFSRPVFSLTHSLRQKAGTGV